MTLAQTRSATYADHTLSPPKIDREDERTWLTRGANFVIAVSQVPRNAVLTRDNPDEYFVFLPHSAARITAGDEHIQAGAETLTIVPPGPSSITAEADGLIVRVFSKRAADLLELAGNHAVYADGAPEVAALVPWPDPPAGFRLRHYVLAEHTREDSNMRIFRSTNLMVNVLAKRPVPRDVRRLSPHTHADFEQASLAIQGTYVHHLRYPWLPDMTTWRDDEHVEVNSPSVTVIPPGILHTSRNISEGECWLVDIFGPPRMDFSLRPGLVCNANEYPMPVAG